MIALPPFDADEWSERHDTPAATEVNRNRAARWAGMKSPAGDTHNRIVDYMRKKEPAISGQGGHAKAFDVAMDLIQGWGLSPAEARPYYEAWSGGCQPPWSDAEITHKLEEADKAVDSQGRARG